MSNRVYFLLQKALLLVLLKFFVLLDKLVLVFLIQHFLLIFDQVFYLILYTLLIFSSVLFVSHDDVVDSAFDRVLEIDELHAL